MKTILPNAFAAVAFSSFLLLPSSFAQVPGIINYQGRVAVNGTNFDGTGQFQFALLAVTNTATTATARANVSSGFITSYTVTAGGAGYTVAPAVTISDPTGTGASATAQVGGGSVTNIVVVSVGTGYSASPTVTVAPPPSQLVGSTLWSNGVNAVSVPVTKGLYSVLLGDTTVANMASSIPASVFTNADVRLRVWFNSGAGLQQLAPDQRIAAVGYALMAGSVPNSAITSGKLAAGAVTASAIASGAVGTAQLASAAITSGKLAAGAVDTIQLADNAVTSSKLAPGAVTASAIASGAVGTAQLANGAVNSNKLAAAGINNANLANRTVIVTAGTGLGGGGAVPLGGSVTLNNAGVLGVTGTGHIASTGGQNPQISFTGTLPPGSGGTGLNSIPAAAGQYLRASGTGVWAIGTIQAGDLPGLSGKYVDLTTTQTVGGVKTFSSRITGSVSGTAAGFTGPLAGNVTGVQTATVVSAVGGVTAAQIAAGANAANSATDANTALRLVKRDDLGQIGVGGLYVQGLTTVNGTNANLAPPGASLNKLVNSAWMLMGWNRLAGAGEADFIANRGTGTTGGFAFFDLTNGGTPNQLVRMNGDGSFQVNGTISATNFTTGMDFDADGLSDLVIGGSVKAIHFNGDGSALTGITGAGITTISGSQVVGGDLAATRLNVGSDHTLDEGLSGYATIAGGQYNRVYGEYAVVGGGISNRATGWATVGGGERNRADDSFATVAGGYGNTAIGNGSFVGGGGYDGTGNFGGNLASGGASVIGGGITNTASGMYATIGGGSNNAASGAATVIGGGVWNAATNAFATVAGGYNNQAYGYAATVPGGRDNVADGQYSLAAGRNAHALHDGSFVFVDSTGAMAWDGAANQFVTYFSGGYTFFSGGAAGVQLAAGGNAWSAVSDRNVKENFAAVDGRAVLAALVQVPVTTWNMKTQAPSIRHIGPMAQDFAAAFGVGEDDRHISTSDADGVALAAIQGLYRELQDAKAQNADLEKRLADLERRLDEGGK